MLYDSIQDILKNEGKLPVWVKRWKKKKPQQNTTPKQQQESLRGFNFVIHQFPTHRSDVSQSHTPCRITTAAFCCMYI